MILPRSYFDFIWPLRSLFQIDRPRVGGISFAVLGAAVALLAVMILANDLPPPVEQPVAPLTARALLESELRLIERRVFEGTPSARERYELLSRRLLIINKLNSLEN